MKIGEPSQEEEVRSTKKEARHRPVVKRGTTDVQVRSDLAYYPPHGRGGNPEWFLATKLERHSKDQSTLKYPLGKPDQAGQPPKDIQIPLGPKTRVVQKPPDDPDGWLLRFVGYTIEYTYPKGTKDCPNHAVHYYKSTDTSASNGEERHPPAKKDAQPAEKGGFEGDKWEEDKTPAGKNAADEPKYNGSSDTEKGFVDTPGLQYGRGDCPITRHVKYKCEVRDCDNKLVDCMMWEYTVEIDKNGDVKTNKVGEPEAC
jgi:hypothetical protein